MGFTMLPRQQQQHARKAQVQNSQHTTKDAPIHSQVHESQDMAEDVPVQV